MRALGKGTRNNTARLQNQQKHVLKTSHFSITRTLIAKMSRPLLLQNRDPH